MALVQLVDALIPEVWNQYVSVNSVELNVFVQSGVIAAGNPVLASFLAGGGTTTNLPFWNDITQTDVAGPTSDDPGSSLVPKKITSGKQVATRMARAQAWEAADLVSELAGSDPLLHIMTRVANYWNGQLTRKLLSIALGVVADNELNDSGDMVEDISVQTPPTAANLFNVEAVIDAKQTMGDHQQVLSAIAMHSVVFTQAKKNNLIDFITDSTNPDAVDIPVFNGLRVVIDDILAPDTAGAEPVYSTYLFGNGAYAYDVGSARVPVAAQREELEGDGGGTEVLVSRVSDALHPLGSQFTGTPAGDTVSNTELSAATSWDRVIDRKLVPFAVLKSNG